MVTRFACMAHRLQSSSKCTMKSSVACTLTAPAQASLRKLIWQMSTEHTNPSLTSCMAISASAVHRNGSGANMLVISRHCSTPTLISSAKISPSASWKYLM